MSKAFTFANPVLSLWQASIAEVHRRRQSVRNRMTPQAAQAYSPPSPTIVDDLMAPAHTVAEAVGKSSSPTRPASRVQTCSNFQEPQHLFRPQKLTAAEICAELAAKFLWAEVSGNEQAAELYAGELKYSVCDVLGWAKCVSSYQPLQGRRVRCCPTAQEHGRSQDLISERSRKSPSSATGEPEILLPSISCRRSKNYRLMSCYIWATSIMPVPRVKLITTSWTSANSCLGTTFPSTPSAAITTCIPAELATTGSSIKLGKNRATSACRIRTGSSLL